MSVAERSGVTGDVPEPDQRRLRCWTPDCKEWYSLPPEDEWPALVIGTWPKYGDVFIPISLCPKCAEERYQEKLRREQDGCDKDV